MSHPSLLYRRILLKLSGEALMGKTGYGIDSEVITRITEEIGDIVQRGVQVGLVVGGGNIFRGKQFAAQGINRVTADQMGMLATVMNALALRDTFQQMNMATRVLSAIRIDSVCEHYTRQQAMLYLEKGEIVIFAAGTGNPLFTTDSAASLRAIEIGAQLMIKATKVDGVYTADPVRDPTAKRFTQLSYQDVLAQQLGVMDLTAVLLCRDNQLPMRVIDVSKAGALLRVVTGQDEGTLIDN